MTPYVQPTRTYGNWLRIPSDQEWTQSRVETLPSRWAKSLLNRWTRRHTADYRGANIELRETTDSLIAVRIPLDASDAQICEAANELAKRCSDRAQLYQTGEELRSAMERVCTGQGIRPPVQKVKDGPAMARMSCPKWWRSKLRRHQGQTVEAAAIQLGLVSRNRDLYISNERLEARLQQNRRNQASLEATTATNECGQSFTLAELAAKSTANKRIRRSELMTRIAGFERVAVDMGHTGLFITITCPSRFHRYKTVNNGATIIDNPAYDPRLTPSVGQKYLARIWSHMRSNFQRKDVDVYGFRIAEPQHDGTPHWHLLLFCAPEKAETLCQILNKHALKDSPDEPGAAQHRCVIKTIDWTKGSAAGYVAKYIAKNIDGEHVGTDLNGQPALETALRVEAWAANWGIRQFQQVGGPPVTAWRELRRIETLPPGAPEHLVQAHQAANKRPSTEGHTATSPLWDKYCRAQGGTSCGRRARIKLAMRTPKRVGRYGDEASPKPFGVETTSTEIYLERDLGDRLSERVVHWIVESNRHEWVIQSHRTVFPQAGKFLREEAPGLGALDLCQ